VDLAALGSEINAVAVFALRELALSANQLGLVSGRIITRHERHGVAQAAGPASRAIEGWEDHDGHTAGGCAANHVGSLGLKTVPSFQAP